MLARAIEQVSGAGVFLSANPAVAFGGPGETLAYTITLVNGFGFTDTFAAALNNGWPVDFPLTTTPAIADGNVLMVPLTARFPSPYNRFWQCQVTHAQPG